MSEGEARARVGVREMRQNLSVYLDRVKDGETPDVTEHGRVVARLVPTQSSSVVARMVEDGRITRAKGRLEDLPPPTPAPPGTPTLSEILLEMRDEEPW